MELLSRPKTEYLLFVSLESLHAESLEWENEIAFWEDEMSFLYKLLHRNWLSSPFPSDDMVGLEKRLIDISSNDLVKAKEEVRTHANFLSSLIETDSFVKEDTYRKKHREILTNMYSLREVIKSFKFHLFEVVKGMDS